MPTVGNMTTQSPLLINPVRPVPDNILYDPQFEDPASVVAWARPVAPEGAFNGQFSPDSRYLVYLAGHPGTRFVSLYSIPLAGGAPVELNRGSVEEEIAYPYITPDSTHVVYYPSMARAGLYSIGIAGGKTVQLTDFTIWEALVSADGQWVVYWGEDAGKNAGLYSVPTRGGTPVKLGEGLAQSGSYKITPDGRYVLFAAAQSREISAPHELYRVPIEGGAAFLLSQGQFMVGGTGIIVTPDSQTVIFGNLFRVAIEGGSPVQLNPLAGATSLDYLPSSSPEMSADGQWLVFLAEEEGGTGQSLYSIPLAGGPAVQLNDALAEGERVRSFNIGDGGGHVFYTKALPGQEGELPLYSVPIEGGKSVQLPERAFIHTSLDGRWLLYGARLEGGGFDIYSIASEGGKPTKLNTSVPTNSAVEYALISSDSLRVIYGTSQDAGGGMPAFDGLYEVSIMGGEACEITGVDGQTRIAGFSFAPDGRTIFADVDYDGDGTSALYAFVPMPLPAPPQE